MCKVVAGDEQDDAVMTTTHSAATATGARTVDRFLDAVAAGTGVPADLFSPDVLLDATVPGWRFAVHGADAVSRQYSSWFGDPAMFEELERLPVDGGEVVTYLVTWVEWGVPHAGHHCHRLRFDRAGRIKGDRFFCGAAGTPDCSPRWRRRTMLVEMHQLASSVEELLVAADRREPFVNPDGRSSAVFERVWIDGVAHVVKYVHPDHDFTMRVSGDVGGRTARAWAAGLLDSAPGLIDHAIVGAALGSGRNGWGSALLMRDVSAELLPGGDVPIPADRHASFIDHLAGFCAASWGWRDALPDVGLLPYASRWAWFGHAAIDGERALGWPERVPRLAEEGWHRFEERAPRDLAGVVDELRRDVTPLAAALRETPSCFLHGDVKASNTGTAPDGRTVLIDWAYVGEGPACHELAWHLALDRARLPRSKEATIDAFRAALEHHGVETEAWWRRQLGLCLLGATVQFGWEKAMGDDEELTWWCDAARDGAAWL
jgi:hypothetical protein